MLTIHNIHKIYGIYAGGNYYVESCASTDTEYGFVMRNVDGGDKRIVSLDRISQPTNGRMVYELKVDGKMTDFAVTADWIADKDNLLSTMNDIC